MSKEKFIEAVNKSYTTSLPSIYLGAGIFEGGIVGEAKVNLALRMMNRHGLVTGATGSGKTRTLQLIAEQLSAAGVPVFMPDIKGDLSGFAKEGATNEKITERANALGVQYQPSAFPVELYSLSGKIGAQMRATVTEFGPVLLSKILELNDTQTGVLNVVFKYADDKNLPIVDFNDLKKVLNHLTEGAGAAEIKNDYGKISSASSGTILRKIVSLEQQGVDQIFGETSFDVDDLFQKVDGRGVISLLNVSDVQTQPALFSTFLLALLAEIYQRLPEAGDLDKPKLIFFLDEAHLLFKDAPKAFMDQIEQIIRLIRSKGVGIFFCTQLTQDVPASVLSQLGNRVHHVIRAFTPNDVKALKETIKTFPKSEFYEMEQQFTQLGTGQAFITVLNEKGIPTETVVTHLAPPASLMGPLTAAEYQETLEESEGYKKYKDAVDPQSAFEILSERMKAEAEQQEEEREEKAPRATSRKQEKSTFESVISSPVAKQVGKEIVRGVFGMLFGTTTPRRRSTRRKSGGLF
ncbi:helicase HerA-like domain-containing protein [Pseudochryseolinea flava]|uniref:ATPase n=1 Tax=Pseudochryseolinea flava TaxID=2059302 RepID=A0A364Y302_9BACT|nr:helicase HerA-like domain-containing protein [Pseudochryseolinea flava]RAW01069.1 ATPase [Pseudochryseolinea flava]